MNYTEIDTLSDNDLVSLITELKSELSEHVVIPGHHYQSEKIIPFTDITGDSYKLAVECGKVDKKFIIFCGVLFMAEGASILGKDFQQVLLPEPMAGCPMADMASIEFVTKAYSHLSEQCAHEIAPVVYMNSYADLKSFCGEHGGSVCTSSNAEKILTYYFEQGKSVMFFPDYYLGKNTAKKLGIEDRYVARIKKDMTCECDGDIRDVKIFLWDGFCPVHRRFTPGDVTALRQQYPDIKIIVHPESLEEVVDASDMSGSTEKILNVIKDAPDGSVWGVGTETTFVHRLAHTYTSKTIVPLRESACKNMVKITMKHLAKSLLSVKKNLESGEKLLYEIKVTDEYKENAKKSLKKMIEIVNA